MSGERRTGRQSWVSSAIVAALSLALSIGLVEVAFRLAGFDFDFKRRAHERTPIFYRQPLLPMEDGLLRRSGPALWEGQVITPRLQAMGVPEEFHPLEPEISVSYDRNGFRNPSGLEDWEIVVAGDSFTELGHLPYRDLFTTRLGERLSVRVKNLGVSYTGPFSYVSYLRRFGGSGSAQYAVLAFFEGNDLGDLLREWRQLREARRRRARGLPPVGERSRLDSQEPQSSVLKAAYRLLTRPPRSTEGPRPNAFFEHRGTRVPVSVTYTPPSLDRVSVRIRELLGSALTDWAEVANALGVEPWLLYLPCKRRVLHQWLVFEPDAPRELRHWSPSRLPDQVRRMAEVRGISFVDATEALQAEAAAGRLPYNGVWDTHLNRQGTEAVAELLAGVVAPGKVAGSPLEAGEALEETPSSAGARESAPLSERTPLP